LCVVKQGFEELYDAFLGASTMNTSDKKENTSKLYNANLLLFEYIVGIDFEMCMLQSN